MDRKPQTYARAACASTLLLLLAATAAAQLARGGASGEERRLRRLYPIDLALGESRLVDRRVAERIRCRGGVLVVQPFGRSAIVTCVPRL